jgi:hypothetical protein
MAQRTPMPVSCAWAHAMLTSSRNLVISRRRVLGQLMF